MKSRVFMLGQLSMGATLITIRLIEPLIKDYNPFIGGLLAFLIGLVFGAIGVLLAKKVEQ